MVTITVHYGDPEVTRRLVRKLESISVISNIVVVLHDDLDLSGSRCDVMQEPNSGYAAGVNLAIRHVKKLFPQETEVLVTNADVHLDAASVERLLAEHQTACADCTFPAIRENGRLIVGYRLTRWGTMRAVTDGAEFFPGTCFLLNVSAWEKAGGLNEEYFHYFEDADFCLRLRQAGCRIHSASAVVIPHDGGSRTDYPVTELPRFAVRNHLLFLRMLGKLNALSFLNVSLRYLLFLFRWKKGWRGIRQWCAGIREFRRRG